MSDKPRVLITCPPMLRAMERYESEFKQRNVAIHCPAVVQTLSEDELTSLLPDFGGWIIGDDPATRRVLAAGHAGKFRSAVKWGIGVDNVDRVAIEELGINFSNTPGVFGAEVADLAVAYLIGLARHLFWIDRQVRAGEWPKPAGASLDGKTVALVGFGDVGQQTARRLLPFGVRLVAYDPKYHARKGLEAVEEAAWADRIEEADFLVLTCALTDRNRHMVNEGVLGLVKPGLRVVNVARGPLIQESALENALATGRVAAAALDVFESEPLPEDSALRHYDRCVFGSHNASNTEEGVDRASRQAMAYMFEFLAV